MRGRNNEFKIGGVLDRCFLLHFFYPVSNRTEEFDEEEIEGDTDEKSYNSHEVFCDKEYQKYDWSRELERVSDDSWIEKISLKCMDDKEHSNNCQRNTPTRILDYPSEENRNPSDKYSEDWYKTREKSDTSER